MYVTYHYIILSYVYRYICITYHSCNIFHILMYLYICMFSYQTCILHVNMYICLYVYTSNMNIHYILQHRDMQQPGERDSRRQRHLPPMPKLRRRNRTQGLQRDLAPISRNGKPMANTWCGVLESCQM